MKMKVISPQYVINALEISSEYNHVEIKSMMDSVEINFYAAGKFTPNTISLTRVNDTDYTLVSIKRNFTGTIENLNTLLMENRPKEEITKEIIDKFINFILEGFCNERETYEIASNYLIQTMKELSYQG